MEKVKKRGYKRCANEGCVEKSKHICNTHKLSLCNKCTRIFHNYCNLNLSNNPEIFEENINYIKMMVDWFETTSKAFGLREIYKEDVKDAITNYKELVEVLKLKLEEVEEIDLQKEGSNALKIIDDVRSSKYFRLLQAMIIDIDSVEHAQAKGEGYDNWEYEYSMRKSLEYASALRKHNHQKLEMIQEAVLAKFKLRLHLAENKIFSIQKENRELKERIQNEMEEEESEDSSISENQNNLLIVDKLFSLEELCKRIEQKQDSENRNDGVQNNKLVNDLREEVKTLKVK